MLKDNLGICPRCGSDACYEQDLGAEYKIHQCYGCGFTTNSQMTSESKFLEEQLGILPELYKDLIFIDEDGHHWMPSAVNNPKQGMIFADGKTSSNWKWSAVKAMAIPEDQRQNFPIPQRYVGEWKDDVKHGSGR